jgi:hypothetical protein
VRLGELRLAGMTEPTVFLYHMVGCVIAVLGFGTIGKGDLVRYIQYRAAPRLLAAKVGMQ